MSQPSTSKLRALLIGGLLGANALVITLSSQSLYQSRELYVLRAEATTQNISSALAQSISGSVEKIDLTLRTVTDEIERQLAGPGLDEQATNAFLVRQAGRLPEIVTLRAVTADGRLIRGESNYEPPGVNWTERDFYAYHRDHAEDKLHLSKPFIGNRSKEYVVALTRRYNFPGGQFAGIVVAPIAIDHLSDLMSRYVLGPMGSIILRDADLGLIARYPAIPDKPAGQIGNSQVSDIGRTLSLSLKDVVSYHAPAGSDGHERIYTLRRLKNAPLLVGVSVARSDYLAAWDREVRRTVAMTLGFLLLSLVTGWMLLRQYNKAKEQQQQLRQSEERLRESVDTYRGILATSQDGYWQVSCDGRLIDVNPTYCRQSGYTREELIGKHISDLEAIESAADAEAHNRRIRERGSDQFESRHRRKDGSLWDVEVSTSYSPDNGGQFFGFIRDITQRKRAESALKLSEEKFRKAFEVSPDAININRLEDGRYVSINGGFTRIMGYSADEIVGRTSVELNIWDDPNERQRLVELLKHDGMVINLETRFRAKDGSLRTGLRSAALIDIEGVPHIIGVTRDITERKHAEDARVKLESQLRESQKMEALGTLAGGVAHDFNNIVAAILGNVELARQDAGPGHAVLESLSEIRKASLRAKALVQQILSFSRRQVIERKVISLDAVVRESERLLRATLPAGVKLSTRCAPDAPAVLADATQIEQVLINLSTNAWQAAQSQGRPGTIEIALEARHRGADSVRDAGFALVSGAMPPGSYACLSVNDNGAGMAEDTLTRIFEPFFTTKPVGKGTGLGLAVVHGIVEEHGGSIEVRSVVGVGSTFRIYLPAAQTAMQVENERAQPAAAPGAGKRVLYLDDDESIVFLMTRLLERQGYRVSGYTDAHAAIAAVRAAPQDFSLAITDYNMPELTGIDVAHALRAIRADIPLAMASGYITEELRQQAADAGISDLIYKPNTVDELCTAVARLVLANAG